MSTLDLAYVQSSFKPVAADNLPLFMQYVNPDVEWTIVNPSIKSFSAAGVFDRMGFIKAITPVNKCFSKPIKFEITHVYVSGKTAIVELTASATEKTRSELINYHCWVCEFNTDPEPKIVRVRTYTDFALIDATIAANKDL